MALLQEALTHERLYCGGRVYLKAPNVIYFPTEDSKEEHLGETKRHLKARTALYLSLVHALSGDAVGSDQFVYYDAGNPRRCLSPDVFVKRGAPNDDFDTWKIWKRGAPDLAVEIASKSDRPDEPWADKFERYQASGIGEVVRFDWKDEAQPLRVWDRVEDQLLERAPESEALRECLALGLWWVIVPGESAPMLRLSRDRDGADLLSTPSEEAMELAEQLAEERAARAQEEHARLLAEHKLREEAEARQRAEGERDAALAELARLRAEVGRGSNRQ